ncbi:SfnB family sulfur acquisition oxidoreductase [Streptomyces sp. CA-253872]|uniref:SfnB family sulfur acquisition oxidoreductase n=1 Tax=Streptomyces sp. CA-253872 TaxID=3240067 RepID=UPI003D8F297F
MSEHRSPVPAAPRERLFFNAFVMNTTSHIHHGQWRRPDAQQHRFNDVETWIGLARLLEEAKFDAMFFADVVGLYGDAEADWSVYVAEGLQIPSNDPTVLVGALAAHTTHLGLAVTSNVFQQHPVNFARQLATLDHLSKGRVAWNIVTGTQDNGYRNFGHEALADHAERYRWADEFVDVTYKLWEGSWDEGALVQDKAGSRHADPAGVHKIFHSSPRYRVEGPFLPSPSPQRTPLLFQAGSSGPGREFAARHAEAVFLVAPSPEIARQQIEETRALAASYGRDPYDLTFHQGLSFVIGDTEEEAAAKFADYQRYVSSDGYAAHAALVDKAGRAYPADTPLSQVDTNTAKGFLENLRRHITDREPTVGDLALQRLRDTVVVGTPERIADTVERWRAAGIDGVNVINWVIPGSFEEFADKVLPVLRARGLAQEEYAEGTLRRKWFGGDRLPARHPAARYRGAFTHGPRSWAEAAARDREAARGDSRQDSGGSRQDSGSSRQGSGVPLLDAPAALAVAERLAGEFAEGAAARDRDRVLPFAQLGRLARSGLLAVTVPRAFGGPGLPASVVAEIVRRVSRADPSIGQIPLSHFVYVNQLRLQGSRAQQERLFGEVLAGRWFGNAQSERGTKHVRDFRTTLTRDPAGEGWRLDGTKFYCTGALFADWIPVLAHLGPEGPLHVAWVRGDADGVSVTDDWDAVGQRTTASGTATFTDVAVGEEWITDYAEVFDGPTTYGSYAQLVHAAIDTGIARAALDDAAAFVTAKSRPYPDAVALHGITRAVDDPVVVHTFGEMELAVRGTEALLAAAGRAVDAADGALSEESAAAASLAVAAVRASSARVSVEVASRLLEVAGTRAALSAEGLDRHWRNARTHTLHDPAAWKVQHLGRWAASRLLPPRHGQL